MKMIKKCFLILMVTLFSIKSVSASSVNIDIKATSVGNILLEIIVNSNEKIEDGVQFYLYNGEGKLINTATSKDSKIFFENVPFGKYKIKIDNEKGYKGEFTITVDMEFVERQHIPLVFNVYTEDAAQEHEKDDADVTDTIKTGDNTKVTRYVLLAGASALGVIVFFLCRKREGDEHDREI